MRQPAENHNDEFHHDVHEQGHGVSSLTQSAHSSKTDIIDAIQLANLDPNKLPAIDIFDGKFRINVTARLNVLDSYYARAYRTTRLLDNDNHFYCMVCSDSSPPRLSQITQLQEMQSQNIILPLGWDIIRDVTGQEYPVILFALPRSQPLLADLMGSFQPQAPIACVQSFLQPLLSTINELHSVGITYRALSPNNLFITPSSAQRNYILGQCLTDPPGTMQPTVFETATAGMAHRDFRGKELANNDVYALGVMMLCLMRGSMPMAHMSDIDIIRRKLNLTSFIALTEGVNIPAMLKDPLRGMLNDNPSERWTLDQVFNWVNGNQTERKTRNLKARSRMSFHYHYENFETPNELAVYFADKWDESVEQTINPDIPIWMRHGVSDEMTSNEIREIQNRVGLSSNMTSKYDANLHIAFAKMLFLLNPYSPILFQDLRFTLTGFGQLFAKYFRHHNSAQMGQVKSIIHNELITYWYHHQPTRSTVYSNIIQEVSLARQAMTAERLEFGFERMLYILYPDLPCLSTFFEKEFVFDLATFLDVMENKLKRLEAQEARAVFQIDRHMIGYIGSRFHRNISNVLRTASDTNSETHAKKAQIIILSLLQEEFSRRPFPTLCHYACHLLEPVLQGYNNVKLRERIRKRLLKTAKLGWINQLLDVIEDARLMRNDQRNYANAYNEYEANAANLVAITKEREHVLEDVADKANRYSLILCLSLAGLGILILLFN